MPEVKMAKKGKTAKLDGTYKCFDVTHQGAPIVNSGHIIHNKNGVILMEIDFRSKWCDIDALSGGNGEPVGVYVSESERTPPSSMNVKKAGEPTKITFSYHKEYDVFNISLNRYTMKVTMIKRKS